MAKFSLTHFQAKPNPRGGREKYWLAGFLVAAEPVGDPRGVLKILEPQRRGEPVVWSQGKEEEVGTKLANF